jgi:hypothetical protein
MNNIKEKQVGKDRESVMNGGVLRQNVASHNVYVTKRNCY